MSLFGSSNDHHHCHVEEDMSPLCPRIKINKIMIEELEAYNNTDLKKPCSWPSRIKFVTSPIVGLLSHKTHPMAPLDFWILVEWKGECVMVMMTKTEWTKTEIKGNLRKEEAVRRKEIDEGKKKLMLWQLKAANIFISLKSSLQWWKDHLGPFLKHKIKINFWKYKEPDWTKK